MNFSCIVFQQQDNLCKDKGEVSALMAAFNTPGPFVHKSRDTNGWGLSTRKEANRAVERRTDPSWLLEHVNQCPEVKHEMGGTVSYMSGPYWVGYNSKADAQGDSGTQWQHPWQQEAQ